MTWLKANMLIKQSGFIKSKKVPLMMIIFPSEVDDDEEGYMVEMIVEVEIRVEDAPTYFPSCNFSFLSFF